MKRNEKILEEILFEQSGDRLSSMPKIYLRAALAAMDKVQSTHSPHRGFTVEEMQERIAMAFVDALEFKRFDIEGIPLLEACVIGRKEAHKIANDAAKRFLDTYLSSLPSSAKVEGEQWVSVKDSLPEIGEYVLVVCNTDVVMKGILMNDGWEVFFRDRAAVSYTVTHWMPLPQPPHPIGCNHSQNNDLIII